MFIEKDILNITMLVYNAIIISNYLLTRTCDYLEFNVNINVLLVSK